MGTLGTKTRRTGFALCALLLLALPARAQPDLLEATANSRVIGAHQRSLVRPAFQQLDQGERARFLLLLHQAETPLARDLLLKSLSSGNSVQRMVGFAQQIRGKSKGWLLEHTQLCGCTGIRQQFSHTCQVTTLQAMRGRYDPIYALRMRAGNGDVATFDKRDAFKVNPELAKEQRALLESIYRGSVQGATAGVALPREQWRDGKRRYLDDLLNELRGSTGLSYATRRVTDVGAATDLLKLKLTQGISVPIVVGEKPGQYTHHLLAYDIRQGPGGAEILIHDPWEARSSWITEADIRGSQIQTKEGSILRHLTYVEVPSRVATTPAGAAGLGPLEQTLLERYLAEQKGVGSQLARRVLKTFGAGTVEVIETQAGRLQEVKGVGAVSAKAIQEAWSRLATTPLPGLEAPGTGAKLGSAPAAGDLPNERRLLEAEEKRGSFRARLTRLLKAVTRSAPSSKSGKVAISAPKSEELSRLRRADGTLDWSKVKKAGPKRVFGEAGGLAHFGLALFLKEVAVVARSGDALRMEEFFDGLMTTDFYKHYGLFVAGARVAEVSYVKYLQRYVRPQFVNGLLKTNLVLAAGMALPMLVEGNFEGRAFVISLASLGLSTTAVRAGVSGIKWVTSLRKAQQAGTLAKVASAGRLARVGGWFYTAAELAVILYVGEELDHAATAILDGRAAREALREGNANLLAALADPKADLGAALDAYHGVHNDYRNFLYRSLEQDEIQLAQRISGIARRAKIEADKQRTALARLDKLPALRARAEREFGSIEAYTQHRAKLAEQALQAEVERVLDSYQQVRAEHLREVYQGPRRANKLLHGLEDLDWLLLGGTQGAEGDPSSGRADLWGRKTRERSQAALSEALSSVSKNRFQAYEDERALVARAAEALKRSGESPRAEALAAHLARIDRLAAADRRLVEGGGLVDLETRRGLVDQIRGSTSSD